MQPCDALHCATSNATKLPPICPIDLCIAFAASPMPPFHHPLFLSMSPPSSPCSSPCLNFCLRCLSICLIHPPLLAGATRARAPRYQIACASLLSLTMCESSPHSGPRPEAYGCFHLEIISTHLSMFHPLLFVLDPPIYSLSQSYINSAFKLHHYIFQYCDCCASHSLKNVEGYDRGMG